MSRIKLVVTDCDGTLVTPDKALTPRAITAVQNLRKAGIAFTVTSSRPPVGLKMLVGPLDLSITLGAFNGSVLVRPDLSVVSQHLIPGDAARAALDFLTRNRIDAWLFTIEEWLILRDDGHYVAHEQNTIAHAPRVVSSLDDFADCACKIVGASADFNALVKLEPQLQSLLGGTAHAARSQAYYLDITPPGQDKGVFVDTISNQLGIATKEIVTLGDMTNDIAMFKRSGVSIAMGNAPDAVKAAATHVTASNTEDGFAQAIESLLASR